MFKRTLICTFLATSMLQTGMAKTGKMKNFGPVFNASMYSLPEVSEPKVVERIKNSEKKRRPANSSNIDESMMSQEMKKIIQKLHTAKTSEDYEEFLTELNAKYDTYPKDVQFYITQMSSAKAFRGIVYRLRPLFEKKSSFLHSQVLTYVKKMAISSSVLLPYEHVGAGFEYISSPFIDSNGKMVEAFKDEKDIQAFLAKEVLPLVLTSVKRLEALDLSDGIVWDQRITFGEKSFLDNIKRFKLIGEFEKNISLASAYSGLASMSVMLAYNVDHSIDLYKQVGFLYGLDGFGIFNKVDGVSAEKVAKVLRKPEFAQTGTLNEGGEKWMEYAYSNSLRSIKRLNDAWTNSADERKNGETFIVNTNYLNINREVISENISMANRIAWSTGIESLRSGVTGEVVQVNYHAIYATPAKDLKDFLPTSFESGKSVSRKVAKGNGIGQTLNYRNYTEGRAKSYNLKVYETYFPSIKTQDDVFKAARVMSHMQGDWLKIIR